jgi:hypothetical protein
VTGFVSVSVLPLLSVTVSVTSKVPASSNVCDAVWPEAPKLQLYEAMLPSGSDEFAPSKSQARLVQVKSKPATGAFWVVGGRVVV